jgi:hypothetical protein
MYPLIYHKSLSLEKWSAYPKTQQILMISNELNRAKNWIIKNRNAEANLAYERAFELIDLSSVDTKWKNVSVEFLRLKETIGELYCQTDKDLNKNNLCLKLLIAFNTESYNLLNSEQ